MMRDNETISIQEAGPARARWAPTQGDELRDLIDNLNLDTDSSERVVSEALNILSQCIPPSDIDMSTTGLVFGYVQSGKTLSFTAVTALARDNDYPLVIVIAGVSNPLLDQSTNRLVQDLRLQTNRKWRLFRNPKLEDSQSIASVLADWRDERLPPARRKTILITVLKHNVHLRNLNLLLSGLNLSRLPVLVIDDEADQAGLNTGAYRGTQSTTYQRLVALRAVLPRHSYLQYTATPQAPLLISIIDILSPQFVEPLTPGRDYVGGETFFEERRDLVRIIPDDEVPRRNLPLHEPPASLLAALQLFFLGVAAGIVEGDDRRPGRNRSMLVHPSRETSGHSQFYHWISLITREWAEVLGADPGSPERTQLIETFLPAYDDLRETVENLPDFHALIEELAFAISHTEFLEVNARPQTPQPEWRNAYSWVLIGGQAMDRGFTVEGLTVTYMPRDLGVGNADSIEQRARFFGYKRQYLGFCRVFLENAVYDAFRFYTEHERDIRERLCRHRETGRPLTEWRRAFFLSSSLRPTRKQVLSLDYKQDSFAEQWFWPKVPHGTPELVEANRVTVESFIVSQAWEDSPGDLRRTADQLHRVATAIPLRGAYEALLTQLRLTSEYDSQRLTGLLLQLDDYLQEHGDATCTTYLMSGGNLRMRSLNADEEIPTLFQGANYAGGDRTQETYPGDSEIHDDDVTIQIHMLEIREHARGNVLAERVPAIAIWIPEPMRRDWLVQKRH